MNTLPYIVAHAEPVGSPRPTDPLPVPLRAFESPVKTLPDAKINMLLDQGYSKGLVQSISRSVQDLPLRIWIVDNSGSMQNADGRRMLATKSKNDFRYVDSTRWEELKECVKYHVELAHLLRAPTSFRLLNGSSQFDIAQAGEEVQGEVVNAMSILDRTQAQGVTPLTAHIREIAQIILCLSPQLVSENKRVTVVIATDGVPTDYQGTHDEITTRDFVAALKELEGLPVWLVIRLCTNENQVVEFYNNLDDQLELSIDVLDDYISEASEIYNHNQWLNYALPIHRMREMGCHDRVFDLLDERPLTVGELRDFCLILFGESSMDGVPDPAVEWSGFLSAISKIQSKEKYQWNPLTKKMAPWIDLNFLNKSYGKRSGSSCILV